METTTDPLTGTYSHTLPEKTEENQNISTDVISKIQSKSNPLLNSLDPKNSKTKDNKKKYEVLQSDKINRSRSSINPSHIYSNNSLISQSSGSSKKEIHEKEQSIVDSDKIEFDPQPSELVNSKGIPLEPAPEWIIENLINPKRTKIQNKDVKAIKEAYVEYDDFCKKFFPSSQSVNLTKSESKQLHVLTQELIDSLKQLLVDIDEPQTINTNYNRKRTTEIYFFSTRSSFNQSDAIKIRYLLNKKIVLNHPLSPKYDVQKFNRLIYKPKNSSFENLLYRNIQQAVSGEDLTEEIAARQEKLSLLFSYQQAIMILCRKISKIALDFPLYSTASDEMSGINIENIKKIVDEINIVIGKRKNIKILHNEISDEIITKYFEGYLEKLLELEASELIQAYEKKVKINVLYPQICEAIYKLFFNLKMQNPANDWFRAIIGRYITILGPDDTELLKPYTEPKDKNLHDEAVKNYILDWQRVVGKQVFNDETLLVNFCELVKKEVDGIESTSNETEASQEKEELEGVEQEKELQIQAKIFKVLEEQMQNKKEIKRLMAKIDQELKKSNPKSMKKLKLNGSTLMDTLFKFYRAPAQAFIWGPTGTLCDVYKILFKHDQLIITNFPDWDHDKTQKIQFKFNKHDMAFRYLKRGYVASKQCLFIQDLTIRIPLPGGEALKDPVTIEFYYQLLGDMDPSEEKAVKGALKRIAFTLKTLGFPPLRRILAPKGSMLI